MKIETNGTGRFEHATVWNDDGEYIGIFMLGKEQQLIDAMTEHLKATDPAGGHALVQEARA